ncbi:MAG: HAMP domain-containing histidine kinase, partial [Arcobacter sp.]|nr:HAMP domain-containing histidine kinase [Arcobacter sp.]
GIPNDVIEHIFESRFTTKGEIQGTGIGLYMSKEIIFKHMSGSIDVKNETFIYDDISYCGAEFTIKIPILLHS